MKSLNLTTILVFLVCIVIGIIYGNYILYKIDPVTKKEWLLYAILILFGATVIGGLIFSANLFGLLK